VFVLALGGTIKSGAATVKLNYVALGDSLAEGYAPDGTIGKGYADYLADDIRAAGLLGEFDKRYAVPGFTSQDILAALQDDKHTDIPGSTDSLGINKRLAQADIITLDIGANDLLDAVKIDAQTGTVSYDPETVMSLPSQVEANVEEIITQIKKDSPTAQIYLMGYYNPFLALPQESQDILNLAISQLNTALNTATSSTGATFVPTQGAISANTQRYLPDSHDIHPNQEGYRVIAGEFWRVLKTKLNWNSLPGRQFGQQLGNNGVRIGGQDRFDTARLIAESTYPDHVDAVILATGNNWPDALTGSVLSNKYHAPILWVNNTPENSTAAMDYIQTHVNDTGTVYILGGFSAVGPEFETALMNSGFPAASITRLSGLDRTSTALEIDENLAAPTGGTVFMVTDSNYADALTASAYAATNACPIIPVPKDSLPVSVLTYLEEEKPSTVIIVGGEGVISQTVENQMRTLVGTVVRYSGSDRYATSSALIASLYPNNPSEVCLATGEDYPDALAGSAYAGFWGEPIVLLPKSLDQPTLDLLHKYQGVPYTIFGGTGAVSSQNASEVQAELEGNG
jgi:putative cell wall-binding protein/lysophospholipase L1-like esterase